MTAGRSVPPRATVRKGQTPAPAKTTPISSSPLDLQRKRIETKIAREEADLKTFSDRAQQQIQTFMAQVNAEIASRAGRIRAYKELLGLEPETDTTPAEPDPAQNSPETQQEGPGAMGTPDQVEPSPPVA